MRTRFIKLLLLQLGLLQALHLLHAQSLSQGPAAGHVSGGVTVSTSMFEQTIIELPAPRAVKNKFPVTHKAGRSIPERSIFEDVNIYSPDNTVSSEQITDTATTFIFKNFAGIGQTNSIPPDPHLAVGPGHIIATVNSDFAIFDKQGNKLLQMSAANWYRTALSGASPFDPKVIYDQFAKRWIMVWLDQNDALKTGYFLVSVSDDENPMGKWNNYALPSMVNGMTFDNSWSDYQGVGYDDKAYYITGDQFEFNGGFLYTKIRIIPKPQLLADSAGAVTWKDFWDIRDPGFLSDAVFNIRPSLSLSTSDAYYLCHSPYYGGNYVIMYKFTGLPDNPVLTARRVPVVSFSYPPDPIQAGSNRIPLEGSVSGLTNEPVYLNGTLWGVHTVSNPVANGYSAIHLFGINTVSGTTTKESIFGQIGYYYMYPSLMVDKYANATITYSRCGMNDFIGAYFASSKAGSNVVRGSYIIKKGNANYIKDFGSGRNRWGDYMGIGLDPVDGETTWMLTEYVSAQDTWDTWIGAARNTPLHGAAPFIVTPQIDFENVEVGYESPDQLVALANIGNQAFTIDSITYNKERYQVNNPLSFPRQLASMDTANFYMRFTPHQVIRGTDTLRFYAGGTAIAAIPLKANGYKINQAQVSTAYGISNGKVLQIAKTTGTATVLGESSFSGLADLAIHPKTGIMYGLVRTAISGTDIVRVNAQAGDAYLLHHLSDVTAVTFAFDTSGALYLGERNGGLYYCNISNGQTLLLTTAKCSITSMVFHPKTNVLWASVYKPIGAGRDKIITINMQTGDTTIIGSTGLSLYTNGLFFDEYGKLYGVKSGSSTTSDFFSINSNTGAAQPIGQIAFAPCSGMEYWGDKSLNADKQKQAAPDNWLVASPYPNPFNPEVRIQVTLAVYARLELRIYNVLGELQTTVFQGDKQPGLHTFTWSPSEGMDRSSGIYFYECTAHSAAGQKKTVGKLLYVR